MFTTFQTVARLALYQGLGFYGASALGISNEIPKTVRRLVARVV